MAHSTAQQVREWARSQGAEGAWLSDTARGRLPKEQVATFNETHPDAPYTPGQKPTVTVQYTVKDKRNRNSFKSADLTHAEIRSLLGEPTSKKGAFSAASLASVQSILSARDSA